MKEKTTVSRVTAWTSTMLAVGICVATIHQSANAAASVSTPAFTAEVSAASQKARETAYLQHKLIGSIFRTETSSDFSPD